MNSYWWVSQLAWEVTQAIGIIILYIRLTSHMLSCLCCIFLEALTALSLSTLKIGPD
jgi:hypothetical protein